MNAATIARTLRGVRSGSGYLCRCPLPRMERQRRPQTFAFDLRRRRRAVARQVLRGMRQPRR